ncbi:MULTISPECIES: peptide-methionine (R)-S-oxide reductase MsrB [Halocynthiibacter]|uniref:peptide-methionine (R)-S-oxide reductase n=1 Tax=Halocynthiibacter halioticoli TaxID=2986804 RepID=A0AAE3IYU1_9RHOB|nr:MULTISPECIES: peptide-methionine (R)-S-oxide reductase MsrB [Halocynthiibacter]MCV6824239.1 peptide-methionine (R)-S-oxide reductase MsrB [Halocynthiibacter halioticoli]MCW4057240.1 peptide-methionine (R)-S-oxide reductase MsrB [Halocynthiibacter sp. SDUM655004]MDE0589731.1 peptide-methionine (R)-S-oxide reductase MsrB [Halocynthiibacter sp. C4]
MAKAPDSRPQEIIKSDADWRAQLSPEAYKVTRKHGTERAHSCDNFPKVDGVFRCICCDTPLFDQAQKYESGTGWPSFYAPMPDAPIGTQEDRKFFMRRTEVHCDVCKAHLGHVFPDGPEPTGLRYCLNGVALRFDPKD